MLRKMVTFIIISLSLLVGCKVNNENILYLDKPKVQKDNLTINFTSSFFYLYELNTTLP